MADPANRLSSRHKSPIQGPTFLAAQGTNVLGFLQLLLSLAVNTIPIAGFAFRDWSPATVLVLYWAENVVGSVLTSFRIAIHRRWTGMRGHERPHFDSTSSGGTAGPRRGRKIGPRRPSFFSEFTTLSLAFCVGHGIFLTAILAIVLKLRPDRAEVAEGFAAMAAAQALAFLLDLLELRRWSFAELKQHAGIHMGRVVLIHLAILGGMCFAAFSERPLAFFGVFAALKVISDIAYMLPFQVQPTEEPPRWFLWLARQFGNGRHWQTGQDAATWWRETTRAELRQAAEDEQPA